MTEEKVEKKSFQSELNDEQGSSISGVPVKSRKGVRRKRRSSVLTSFSVKDLLHLRKRGLDITVSNAEEQKQRMFRRRENPAELQGSDSDDDFDEQIPSRVRRQPELKPRTDHRETVVPVYHPGPPDAKFFSLAGLTVGGFHLCKPEGNDCTASFFTLLHSIMFDLFHIVGDTIYKIGYVLSLDQIALINCTERYLKFKLKTPATREYCYRVGYKNDEISSASEEPSDICRDELRTALVHVVYPQEENVIEWIYHFFRVDHTFTRNVLVTGDPCEQQDERVPANNNDVQILDTYKPPPYIDGNSSRQIVDEINPAWQPLVIQTPYSDSNPAWQPLVTDSIADVNLMMVNGEPIPSTHYYPDTMMQQAISASQESIIVAGSLAPQQTTARIDSPEPGYPMTPTRMDTDYGLQPYDTQYIYPELDSLLEDEPREES